MGRLRDLATSAAHGVMSSPVAGARATTIASVAARTATDLGSTAAGAAVAAAGALVVAAEQVLGTYEPGEYATFRTDH